jgi:predicted acylesterase/phospholipase RssA
MESETPLNDVGSGPLRVLSLDGGGAKGFYTLGILDEIERNFGRPLHTCFDLIFGTSTGSIIAALLARGDSVESVIKIYREHVPAIMKPEHPAQRTAALRSLAKTVFENTQVSDFKTRIGIVATNWKEEKPFIFKASVAQAHGSVGSFVPFFGCNVADAVIASCSAFPFFETHIVTTSKGDIVELADGGFCANNPTLYAIADATLALKYSQENLRVVSLGVGAYPPPSFWKKVGRVRGGWGLMRHSLNSDFLQKILDTNTGSMEQLRDILFKKVRTIRISEPFVEPAMATDLLEHDLTKLNRLVQKGRISYQKNEKALLDLLKS